jgi:CRISPR-associated protein (TIGR03986 family)
MPGKPDKQHRIRVTTMDGKPRDQGAINKLKSNQLGMPHLDIVTTNVTHELIICASKEAHLEQVKGKLGGVGLEPVDGGDTTIKAPEATPQQSQEQGGRRHQHQQGASGKHQHRGALRSSAQEHPQAPAHNTRPLQGKPYGFVGLPKELMTAAPIWHDGTTPQGLLSGEIRFELETLTPMLVGWERQPIVPKTGEEPEWPIEHEPDGPSVNMNLSGRWSHPITPDKSVLCPLRAPWGQRPVVIPGDSLKGLLRHELGALLGAPMERVAERTYSYRPNQKFPYDQRDQRYRQGTAALEPRLARVRTLKTMRIGDREWPIPGQVDVLSMATREQQFYFPRRERQGRDAVTVHPSPEAEQYRGGLGGGRPFPDQILAEEARRKIIHTHIDVSQLHVEHQAVTPSTPVIEQYAATLRHLIDVNEGHFSARHPHIGTDQEKQRMGRDAVKAGAERAFQPGDLVWVEWDTEKRCIVSFGWHYYYRWAYVDTVRKDSDAPRLERYGLFPLGEERERDSDDAPMGLSLVRRLFGYAFDKNNAGVATVGKEKSNHSQLMGRVFVNSGVEVIGDNDSDDKRFLKPTFLKELGMPRPSAVEHYLKQNLDPEGRPQKRPSDQATLVTYGDAAGYDEPGELAGRKFYLDRKDAYDANGEALVPGPAEDVSAQNRLNERSTLALEATKPGSKFRFTVRFRDLEPSELAAVIVALCPDQFKGVLGGNWKDGYCSKLGYARPLGWGSVRIEAKHLLLLDEEADTPTLRQESNPADWVKNNHKPTMMQKAWLDIHRRKHPNAKDYPRPEQFDRNGERNIYTYHSTLRAEHSRARRYRNK